MRLFHGGVPGLKPGDVLVPGRRHYEDGCPVCTEKARGVNATLGGIAIDPVNQHEDRVYVTSDREYARFYASKYPMGDLYVVAPLGEQLDVGSEDPFLTWAVASARVVSVYERTVRLTHRQRVTLLERWRRVDQERGLFGVNRLPAGRLRVPRL
jgi:hypothetical protein